MKEWLYFIFVLFLFCGMKYKTSELRIIGFNSAYLQLQIKNDFNLLNNLFFLFSKENSSKITIQECKKEGCGKALKNKDGSYLLKSESTRGNWVHEMAHAFSDQLKNPNDFKEFLHEVLEHFINGYSPEMVNQEVIRKGNCHK